MIKSHNSYNSDTDTIAAIAIHMKGAFLAAAGNGNDIFVYDNVSPNNELVQFYADKVDGKM